jgi:hypothetical protein
MGGLCKRLEDELELFEVSLYIYMSSELLARLQHLFQLKKNSFTGQ